MAEFTDLFFGMADAKNEASDFPDEFVRTFVDHQGVVEAIRARSKFLLLGPKGTGKTAAAWYLELTARDNAMLVATRDVSELPLAEVSNLKTGESGGPGRTITAWRLIVLCALLDLVLEDQSSTINSDPEVLRVARQLREFGFLDPTPGRAILTAARTTIKIPLPSIGEVYSRETTNSIHLYHLVPYLQKWIATNTSENSYVLLLDGLDSIYLNDRRYLPILTGLIQAVYLVNQELRRQEASAHVVLLVRNDVFSRLELADAGKIRTDFGIDLDWRMLSANPRQSSIFRLVNEKATALLEEQSLNVVDHYLPPTVVLGARGATRPVYEYLLGLTRHTPRDLLQLLENVRRSAAEMSMDPDGRVPQAVLREGVLRYANRYFVDAINDELVGHGTDNAEARSAVTALRDMRKRAFTADEYTIELFGPDPSREDQARAEERLRWLFFAGAIGNVVPGARTRYLQFFHRRDDSDIYLKGSLVLHNALVHAWAIPWI